MHSPLSQVGIFQHDKKRPPQFAFLKEVALALQFESIIFCSVDFSSVFSTHQNLIDFTIQSTFCGFEKNSPPTLKSQKALKKIRCFSARFVSATYFIAFYYVNGEANLDLL